MFSTVPNGLQESAESCVLRLKIKKQSLLLKPYTKQKVKNIDCSNLQYMIVTIIQAYLLSHELKNNK